MPRTFYSVGPCPVCFEAGALVVVGVRASARCLLWCPACDVAWARHPRGRVDAALDLSELAPGGLRRATRQEALSFGRPEAIDLGLWRATLPEGLGSEGL